MASLQPSWLSSVSTIKNKNDSSAKQKLKLSSLKLSFFLNATSNNDEASEQPTSENSPEPEASLDPVKLAFEKAKAYRKLKESNSDSKYEQNPDKDAARAAVEKAKECKKNKDTVSFQNGTNSGTIVTSGTCTVTELMFFIFFIFYYYFSYYKFSMNECLVFIS